MYWRVIKLRSTTIRLFFFSFAKYYNIHGLRNVFFFCSSSKHRVFIFVTFLFQIFFFRSLVVVYSALSYYWSKFSFDVSLNNQRFERFFTHCMHYLMDIRSNFHIKKCFFACKCSFSLSFGLVITFRGKIYYFSSFIDSVLIVNDH